MALRRHIRHVTKNTYQFNDLWNFSPTSKMWTWVSGSSSGTTDGIYGTEGVPDATNVPGSREGAISWIDLSGNLWLLVEMATTRLVQRVT